MSDVRLTRRDVLARFGLSVAGLAIGAHARADEPSGFTKPKLVAASQAVEDSEPGLNPNVFVHVDPDGLVTIVCARSEMGQGVRSSIPMLVADEIGADPARVKVVQAVGDAKYGDQNTDGSSSIRNFYDDYLRIGATVREMLVAAAAKRWKVSPKTCTTKDGAVVHTPTGRKLGFGELVDAASTIPVPTAAKPRPRAELTHVDAETAPVLDAADIVRGKAVFGADVRLPDMLVAVVARPPVVGGKVVKVDDSRALAVPGVKKVVRLPEPTKPWKFQPWGGVGVVATSTWAAMKGRAALEVSWEPGENASYDSRAFREDLLASVREPGKTFRNLGDVDAAMATASRVVEAEYYVPHLAHLMIEPPVAIARVADGKCEVWAPTQHPQAARSEVARLLGLDEGDVTVNVTLLGGAFGRKSKADFVAEAAFLSREAGAPVRVQWTREDDVKHGYYNAVDAQRLRAGLDAEGRVVAWHHRTAFPPIASTYPFTSDADPNRAGAADLQQGVLDWALDVPNIRAEACEAKAHTRVGWYRSVYNIFHAFGVGSFIDEIAHARGRDPREVLLEIIGPPRVLGLADLGVESLANYGASLEKHPVDAGRLRRVVERVTEAAKWGDRVKDGRSLGLAAHRSFLSYAAVVVSVVPDERRGVRVDEAWISLDPGIVVNRERVRAQMQGAVTMGLHNAMLGGVTMKDGITQQSGFRDARIPRIGDVPRRIHLDLVESTEPPGGVGEPGVPPVAPAIANAVFALTGMRIRDLPLQV